jgi:hypothetical protein
MSYSAQLRRQAVIGMDADADDGLGARQGAADRQVAARRHMPALGAVAPERCPARVVAMVVVLVGLRVPEDLAPQAVALPWTRSAEGTWITSAVVPVLSA